MNPNRSYRGLLSGARSGDIMAGEQAFKAVVNGTVDHRAYAVDITGANYNHFLGKKIGDSVDGMFVGDGDQHFLDTSCKSPVARMSQADQCALT